MTPAEIAMTRTQSNIIEGSLSKPGKKGLTRLLAALRYSLRGLAAAWRFEAAFRLEVVLAACCLPLAFWLAQSHVELLLLLLSMFAVIIAELVNSAIEAVVDRTGSELHELSGRAKDIGSAVVLMTLVQFLIVWIVIGVQRLG